MKKLILVFAIFVFFYCTFPVFLMGGWLFGWNYRKALTINNNSNSLTDYQVLTTLDTQSLISSGKMRSDCGDIRFTDSDGQTQLNYWIESGCNTSSTKIWVKVPSIPANSTKTIYFYYGNPSATSQSSVANTFIREIDGDQPVKGAWPFDEGSGTTAYDKSGNNNDVTLYNGPTWVSGKFGNALSFDGVNDYVERSYDPDFTPGINTWTVSAWIKDSTGTSVRTIVSWYRCGANPSCGSADTAIYELYINSNNYAVWYVRDDNGNSVVLTSSFSVADNSWHYLVGTFDPANDLRKLYVDGVIVAISTSPLTSLSAGTVSIPLEIGRHFITGWGSPTNYFNGLIDEVHIYARALNDAEISDLYNYYGYVTTNYPGKVLVRKYTSPEPTTSVRAEEFGMLFFLLFE
jgi:hypothetical protein